MFDRRLPGRRRYAGPCIRHLGCMADGSRLRRKGAGDPGFRAKYHTACITCHTVFPKLNNVGEAFRRNGYQFPSDEEVLVKEEPVKMGVDSYKDMFPNSIWPSSLPSIPPISLFTYAQNIVNLQPHGQEKTWDMAFPADIELLGASTFGKDISGLLGRRIRLVGGGL